MLMIKKTVLIFFLVIISVNAQNNFQNQTRLAKTYANSGELEKAKNIYLNLLKIQPQNIGVITELNNIYIKIKEYDASIELLSEHIEKNPTDIRTYCLLANTYYEIGDHNKAFDLWDEAVNVKPKDKYSYKMVSGYAINNRAFDKATEILELGKSRTNDISTFSYDLAHIYSITNQYKKAAGEYCQLLKSSNKQINLVRSRIVSYINKPDALTETIPIIEEFYSETENIVFLELQKNLFYTTKNFEQFYQTALKIDSFKNNGIEVFNFANSAYSEKEYELATKAYKYVIEKYPNTSFTAASQIGYGKTLEAELREKYASKDNWKTIRNTDTFKVGAFNEVVNVYNQILKQYPKSKIKEETNYRIGLVKLEKLDEPIRAKKVFQNIINDYSYSPYAVKSLQKLGEIAILEGNLVDAEEFFTKSEKHRKASTEEKQFSRLMISKVLFWKGQFQKSLKSLNQITANLSGNYANDAIELEMVINTFRRDSLNLAKFAEADLLIEQKKLKNAELELKNLSENSNLFLLNDFSAVKYSEVLIALNNYTNAIEVLEKIVENEIFTAFSDKGLYLLALTYDNGLKDINKALFYYEKLLEKFPNSLYLDKSRKKINLLKKSVLDDKQQRS